MRNGAGKVFGDHHIGIIDYILYANARSLCAFAKHFRLTAMHFVMILLFSIIYYGGLCAADPRTFLPGEIDYITRRTILFMPLISGEKDVQGIISKATVTATDTELHVFCSKQHAFRAGLSNENDFVGSFRIHRGPILLKPAGFRIIGTEDLGELLKWTIIINNELGLGNLPPVNSKSSELLTENLLFTRGHIEHGSDHDVLALQNLNVRVAGVGEETRDSVARVHVDEEGNRVDPMRNLQVRLQRKPNWFSANGWILWYLENEMDPQVVCTFIVKMYRPD